MRSSLLFILFVYIISCKPSGNEANSNADSLTDASGVKQASLEGAWETIFTNEDNVEKRIVAILSGGYIAQTQYSAADGAYDFCMGGSWTAENNTITITFEFDTSDSSNVGTTQSAEFTLEENTFKIDGSDLVWSRIDDGKPGDLNGAWLITGRKRDGELSRRTPGARKTMKILSGTRFQWIAYNIETKQFMGTGGGTYTTENGKYTESIEFFSRDNSRVGANLEFDYEIKDCEWHHSGLSSKGDPIYEIWTKRTDLE